MSDSKGQQPTKSKALSAAPNQAESKELKEPKPQPINEKKWGSFVIRAVWTIAMVAGFTFAIMAGHIWLALMINVLQILAYREVINITGDAKYFEKVPWGRAISWFLLVVAMYYLNGEAIVQFFRNVGVAERVLSSLLNHHRFLSYMLYMTGFIFFVITLREGFYRQQLSQYCVSHFAVFLLVVQGHFIAENILHGIFWLLVPCGMVIINDISAYLCGITMGKHPLIKISPKKTWEGFLGAWIGTVLGGIVLTHYMRKSFYLICPMESIGVDYWSNDICVPNPVFRPETYAIPECLLALMPATAPTTFELSPIYFHVIGLATFASLIAPFGGFFASGFKRTFKVKDFGDTIPGHGGVTDRFDCQFIMGYFTWIYYVTFVAPSQGPSLDRVVSMASSLSTYDQEQLVEALTRSLRPQI